MCTDVLYCVTYCKLRTVQFACTVHFFCNRCSLVWWALPSLPEMRHSDLFNCLCSSFLFLFVFYFKSPSDISFIKACLLTVPLRDPAVQNIPETPAAPSRGACGLVSVCVCVMDDVCLCVLSTDYGLWVSTGCCAISSRFLAVLVPSDDDEKVWF